MGLGILKANREGDWRCGQRQILLPGPGMTPRIGKFQLSLRLV
jgi:hypothetical protein